jgi:GT2 family glycosyltransferase
MKPKIAITAPIFIKNIAHKRYLDETTRSIDVQGGFVWFPVENYISPEFIPLPYAFNQDPKNIVILKREEPQSVAKAWNAGVSRAKELGCKYVLIINTDIIFKRGAIDNLINFADKHIEYDLISMSEYTEKETLSDATDYDHVNPYPHFSSFLIRADFPERLCAAEQGENEPYPGLFDENFISAYYEDNDFAWRMVKHNFKAVCFEGARFFHYGSRTIKEDSEMFTRNQASFSQNGNYFLQKWGHPVVSEPSDMEQKYFKFPFNK